MPQCDDYKPDSEVVHEDIAWVLGSLRSAMVGAVYIWEPENRQNPRAYCRVRVVAVDWNGDEFTVTCDPVAQNRGMGRCVNSLQRFMEAISAENKEAST